MGSSPDLKNFEDHSCCGSHMVDLENLLWELLDKNRECAPKY